MISTIFRNSNPRNPRSLFGLAQALQLQKKKEAPLVVKEYELAWRNADFVLRLEQM